MASDQRPTILIVNDNDDSVDTIRSVLDNLNVPFNIKVEKNADAALEAIKNNPPDIMILDVSLPQSDINQHIPPEHAHKYSLPVAQAYEKVCPRGTTILLSTYALSISHLYPKNVISINFLDVFENLPSALEPMLGNTLDNQNQSEIKQEISTTPPHHISRIQAVRRSDVHNGSVDADEQCWSVKTGPMQIEEERRTVVKNAAQGRTPER